MSDISIYHLLYKTKKICNKFDQLFIRKKKFLKKKKKKRLPLATLYIKLASKQLAEKMDRNE